MNARITDIFKANDSTLVLAQASGLEVKSPMDGALLARLSIDNNPNAKIVRARVAQPLWASLKRKERTQYLENWSAAIRAHRDDIAEVLHLESGKTMKESLGEVDASAEIILKTLRDASLPELNGMLRCKERPPVGAVGLITSFNFPMTVAHWTLAPALLAGNAVVWKPSEKTPLTALLCKAVFDKAFIEHSDVVQVLIGAREVGEALVDHEEIDMISATGSVAMGQCIKVALAKKKNNAIKPILELGGNNGVIISGKITPEHLQWSVQALMGSYLGTTGQRCTNTRRLIVHRSVHAKAVELLKGHLEKFLAANVNANAVDPANEFGYNALIDKDAYTRFENAKQQVKEEAGEVLFGKRILQQQYPNGYYVEPALALLPVQRSPKFGSQSIMYRETFGPILFVVPYEGGIAPAIEMLNAPANAGLVSAIYTQSQPEADLFVQRNQAGHSLINSPKGTGTPAHGMGFGGNGESGSGEILNSADPLQSFTRDTKFTRIAQNKDVVMSFD